MTNAGKEAAVVKGTDEPKRKLPEPGDMLAYVNSFSAAEAKRFVENGMTPTGAGGYFEHLNEPSADVTFGQRVTVVRQPDARNMHMLAISPDGRPCWYRWDPALFADAAVVDLAAVEAKNREQLAGIAARVEEMSRLQRADDIENDRRIADRKREILRQDEQKDDD